MDEIPSIRYLKDKGIEFEVKTFPEDTDRGALPIAEILGVEPDRVVKTLVVKGSSGKFYVCLVGGMSKLSFDRIKRTAGEGDITMASPQEIFEQTGYHVGAIPPFTLRNDLEIFIDESLKQYEILYVGAGRFGFEILISPNNLQKATNGIFANIIK